MNKLYAYFVAFMVGAASLSSCSQSNYAFKPNTSPYHGSATLARAEKQQQAASAEQHMPEAVPTTDAAYSVANAPSSEVAGAATSATKNVVAIEGAVASKKRATSSDNAHKAARKSTASAAAHASKPGLVEKAMVAKVVKKINRHSDVAGVSGTKSQAGKAAIVAGIGLLLLILGGATGVGLIALLGLIALIVGIVMLIVSLVNN